MPSPNCLLILFSEPASLLRFLLQALKPLRVCLPEQIRVYLIKCKRAIWLLILTSHSYLLVAVSFIDQFLFFVTQVLLFFFQQLCLLCMLFSQQVYLKGCCQCRDKLRVCLSSQPTTRRALIQSATLKKLPTMLSPSPGTWMKRPRYKPFSFFLR